ncbi:apolipoprotein A-IV-like [Myxocyprinus asiaticus]|uniref:apolipoprotein A-IV-like n=1 Tax=Myxocyprinus asiaticus TaxID=70543 RepID=UPI002222BBFC|nr:apolipoprotein A-IV-like [Myxocyprinus asiaticus]
METMRVLLVLALAVLTGCQANIFNTTDETIHDNTMSKVEEDINATLSQNNNTANQYAITLKDKMNPLSEDLMSKITKEAEVLREHLEQGLIAVRNQLEPYAENIKSQIQQRVEDLRAAMAPYAESLDSETLQTTLIQIREELRGSLEQSVKELQAQLDPYTADLKEYVDQYLQEYL